MRIFTSLWIFAAALLTPAEESLQISTWPSNAEIFVRSPPSPRDRDVLHTPCSVTLPTALNPVQLYFFKPGYRDTSIYVRLRPDTTNYLYFHLTMETNSVALEQQGVFLRKRSHGILGRRLMWASSIPMFCAGIFAWQTSQAYADARESQKEVNQSVLTASASYQELVEETQKDIDRGDRAKKKAIIASAIAGLFFATGFIFYF